MEKKKRTISIMKKKKKKRIILISILSSIVVAIGGVALWLFWGSLFPEKTFDVTGIVLVDGAPVSNFTVNSTAGDVMTDADGKYAFTELKGEITISVEDSEYFFGLEDTTFSDDATFNIEGRAYRALNGQVMSGMVKVPFAKVTVVADNGSYQTIADENGEFEIPKVVGSVTITAEKDGMQLFDKTIEETESEVTINATTAVCANFNFDEPLLSVIDAGITIKVNGEEIPLTDTSISLEGLKFGDEIELVSSAFGFENNVFTITDENQTISVNAYKLYTVSGVVKSGEVFVEGASIFINGEQLAVTNEFGEYTIEGLCRENTLTAKKDGFTICTSEVDKDNLLCDFEILKKVTGTLTFENKGYWGAFVRAGAVEVETDVNGEYYLECKLGDTLNFILDGYYIDGGNVLIDKDTEQVNANAEKYYNLSLTILRGANPIDATVTLGGVIYQTENGAINLENLYGEKSLEIVKDGFKFEGETLVSRHTPNVIIEAFKLINVLGQVKSGELLLNGKIYLDGEYLKDFENGEFSIENITESGEVTIQSEGYDTFTATVSETENQVVADLTYSVKVNVISGKNAVSQYKIKIGENESEVETEYTFIGLKGENTLEFIKEYYTADSITVSSNEEITFNATYSVKVTLLNNGVAVGDRKVILIDNETEYKIEMSTDEKGEVTFTLLDSEYTMFLESKGGVVLKPDYYLVKAGGEYDFSNSGYSFNGRVTCGGVGVGYVKIVAGDKIVYTDQDGYYNFDLVSSDCNLVITKEGYEFDKNGLAVTEEDNGKTIDVTATYTIKGKVLSGSTAIQGVLVTLGEKSTQTDENGEYVINGIDVSGETLTFAKDGYEIESNVVNGYGIFDKTAYVLADFKVVSGDLVVDGATLKVNGEEKEKYLIGEVVTAEKAGYEFTSVEITSPNEYLINGTYTITGSVKNGEEYMLGATIKLNGEDYAVSSDGFFKISGLQGENTITATLGDFEFTTPIVTAPTSIVVSATYTVNFSVKCGTTPLSNVKINVADKEAFTDENGLVTISGLTGKNTVILTKNGYSFTGTDRVTGSCNVEYLSTYSVSGRVTCVGKALNGVTVESGLKIVYTDQNGLFTISGLTGENEFVVKCNGYETQTFTASVPENKEISLKYSVVINFSGLTDYSGITVKYNGESIITENQSALDLKYFDSEITISLEKSGYKFTPATITVSSYKTYNVEIVKVYNVSGTVKTASGTPVTGLKMTAGNSVCYTDGNGNYTLSDLTGKVQINGSYPISNHKCTLSPVTVTDSGTYNFNSISDSEYAWGMYLNGFNNLEIGSSYEIIGGGTIDPQTSLASGQTAGTVKRKDTKGNIVTVNMNYGEPAAGIETSVALISFYNKSTGGVQYKQVKGQDTYVFSDLTAKYSDTDWSYTDYGGWQGKIGSYPDKFLPYTVNDSTMKSLGKVTKSGGGFTLHVELSTDKATWGNYSKQMELLSGQVPTSFKYINIDITYNSNGFITYIAVSESYVVHKVVDITINANLTYEYKMPSLDYKIKDLDVSSESAIQESVRRSWY